MLDNEVEVMFAVMKLVVMVGVCSLVVILVGALFAALLLSFKEVRGEQ